VVRCPYFIAISFVEAVIPAPRTSRPVHFDAPGKEIPDVRPGMQARDLDGLLDAAGLHHERTDQFVEVGTFQLG
jgi:hypothetical protein